MRLDIIYSVLSKIYFGRRQVMLRGVEGGERKCDVEGWACKKSAMNKSSAASQDVSDCVIGRCASFFSVSLLETTIIARSL